MKRVLITGAAGFIGANLARRLLRAGHPVHLLVRSPSWRLDGLQGDFHFQHVNLEDAPAVARAVATARPDWVFNLAAYGASSRQTDARRMAAVNLLGTINLLEACQQTGCAAFVQAGSSSEYGIKDHAPAEEDWLEPNSSYAVTKAAATHYCRHVALSGQLPVTIVRLYSIFGPYEEPDRLLPTLVVAGMRGRLPPLVHPDIGRDYVFIDDACDGLLLAATRTGPPFGAVYNLGTGQQTSLRQLVELARRVLDIAEEPLWGSMPDRHWDTTVWLADSRRLRALGWQPRFSLEQGLCRLVDWFRANPQLHRLYRDKLFQTSDSLDAPSPGKARLRCITDSQADSLRTA
jgi:UDP-glucose 4-epimerase